MRNRNSESDRKSGFSKRNDSKRTSDKKDGRERKSRFNDEKSDENKSSYKKKNESEREPRKSKSSYSDYRSKSRGKSDDFSSEKKYSKKSDDRYSDEKKSRRSDDKPFKTRKSYTDDNYSDERKSRYSEDKPFKTRKSYSDDSISEKKFKKKSDERYSDEKKSRRSDDKPFKSRKSYSDESYSEDRKSRYSEDKPFKSKKNYSDDSSRDDRRSKYSKDRNNEYPRSKSSYKKRTNVSKDDTVRLNKYISNAGICSRREADDLIKAGLVSVNGKVITELGTKISPKDDVRFNGERLISEKKVYILLNKPKDYVTTVEDPHAEQTVLELIRGACKERVYPVGRLDRQTTGVLLLTNDGEMTKKLTHPKYNKKKIYHVTLDKGLKKSDMVKLMSGIQVEEGLVSFDAINYIDDEDKSQVGVEIHFGMNRIVRRMFEALEYKVKKLDRVYFAGLTKKGLQRGHWRFLTQKEISILKMGSYE